MRNVHIVDREVNRDAVKAVTGVGTDAAPGLAPRSGETSIAGLIWLGNSATGLLLQQKPKLQKAGILSKPDGVVEGKPSYVTNFCWFGNNGYTSSRWGAHRRSCWG